MEFKRVEISDLLSLPYGRGFPGKDSHFSPYCSTTKQIKGLKEKISVHTKPQSLLYTTWKRGNVSPFLGTGPWSSAISLARLLEYYTTSAELCVGVWSMCDGVDGVDGWMDVRLVHEGDCEAVGR